MKALSALCLQAISVHHTRILMSCSGYDSNHVISHGYPSLLVSGLVYICVSVYTPVGQCSHLLHYSETSDKGPSEKRTTSLVSYAPEWSFPIAIMTSEKRTWLVPMCPLFRGKGILNWILSRENVLFSEGPLSEVLLTVLVLMVCLVLYLAGGVDKCLSQQLNRRQSTSSNMAGTLIKVGHYSRGNIQGRASIIWWGIIQGRGWVLFEEGMYYLR